MMNNLNLIILGIIIVVIICIGIYLYKNNQVNKEPFYQTSGAVNPITIADMATSVMANPTTHEYAVFKMIGSLNTISNTNEIPLYKSNMYSMHYPSVAKSNGNISINIDNNTGKITLSPTKKYRITLSFNRLHYGSVNKITNLDLLINSYNSSDTRIPDKSFANTALTSNNTINQFSTSLNIFTIITDVSYIIPLIRYRDAATANATKYVDSSTYMLIETVD